MTSYFFDFEKTALHFEQRGALWAASLPHSAAAHHSLLVTISRVVANWREVGCPPSGYPANAPAGGDERHPLEVCEDHERVAIARMLNVHDLDHALYLAQRSIEKGEAEQAFRESRALYRGAAKMLLLQAACEFPECSGDEHVDLVGRTLAARFSENYFVELHTKVQVSRAN